MAFTQRMLEEAVRWCWENRELASARLESWRRFFGDDDERPISYWGGAEELNSRERRFLGYFLFHCELPSGEKPAEAAVRSLYRGDTQAEALAALAQSRFVFAVVGSIGVRSVTLELQDERFEVRSLAWARTLTRGTALAAHLVPARFGHWLLGPGWVNLPFRLGPGILANLEEWQLDPIELERMLQGRTEGPDEHPAPPEDRDLAAAVSRMTDWAQLHRHDSLVRSVDDWRSLVLKHLNNSAIMEFYDEIMNSLPRLSSEEELRELSELLTNIWNNTPQPDRGGRTANELVRLRYRS